MKFCTKRQTNAMWWSSSDACRGISVNLTARSAASHQLFCRFRQCGMYRFATKWRLQLPVTLLSLKSAHGEIVWFEISGNQCQCYCDVFVRSLASSGGHWSINRGILVNSRPAYSQLIHNWTSNRVPSQTVLDDSSATIAVVTSSKVL